MSNDEEWVTASEAVAMLQPALFESQARERICERAHAGLIRTRAEHFQKGGDTVADVEIPREFWWAEGHQALDQDWVVGDFSTWNDNRIPLKAFGVTFALPDIQKLLPPGSQTGAARENLTDEDGEILKKLEALVPSAARSYKQAILDLGDDKRISFRGPALELREALREILDHLAPDADVMASPVFTQESDKPGPTMRQKVRFILRKKGTQPSSEPPEQAVVALEEALSKLTRAVYERASKATHIAGERGEVIQIRRYVVTLFHEIL